VSPSLCTSCEAADNPVLAAIECNDDGASVNAALCQVAHDECQFLPGGSVGAAVTDEAAPSCNLAQLCQVSRPSYWTTARLKKNSMPSGSQQIRPIAMRETSTLWLRVRSSGRRGGGEIAK
jgi:hypothetical protein